MISYLISRNMIDVCTYDRTTLLLKEQAIVLGGINNIFIILRGIQSSAELKEYI